MLDRLFGLRRSARFGDPPLALLGSPLKRRDRHHGSVDRCGSAGGGGINGTWGITRSSSFSFAIWIGGRSDGNAAFSGGIAPRRPRVGPVPMCRQRRVDPAGSVRNALPVLLRRSASICQVPHHLPPGSAAASRSEAGPALDFGTADDGTVTSRASGNGSHHRRPARNHRGTDLRRGKRRRSRDRIDVVRRRFPAGLQCHSMRGAPATAGDSTPDLASICGPGVETVGCNSC